MFDQIPKTLLQKKTPKNQFEIFMFCIDFVSCISSIYIIDIA